MKCADNIAIFKAHYFKSNIFKKIRHVPILYKYIKTIMITIYVRDPCIIWLFYTYTNNVKTNLIFLCLSQKNLGNVIYGTYTIDGELHTFFIEKNLRMNIL